MVIFNAHLDVSFLVLQYNEIGPLPQSLGMIIPVNYTIKWALTLNLNGKRPNSRFYTEIHK